ncbi:MAG: hypothetical protein QW057_01060 [Candidatus Bathyarchaeia archaeon]
MKTRRRRKGTVMRYSFLLTLVILTSAAVALSHLFSQTPVEHLPEGYDFKRSSWMAFVPAEAEKVSMLNLTQLFSSTGNYTILPNNAVIEAYGFETTLTVNNTLAIVSVYLPGSSPAMESFILNILKPSESLYRAFAEELEQKAESKLPYLGQVINQVTVKSLGGPLDSSPRTGYVKASITLVDGLILYSEGLRGEEALKKAIQTSVSSPGFFDERDVKASLYLLNVNSGEIGFSYSTFPGGISAAESTAILVRYEGGPVTTRTVYGFNDTYTAVKSLDAVKRTLPGNERPRIVDNYIVAEAKYGSELLLREIRSL